MFDHSKNTSQNNDVLIAIDFQNVYLPGQEWACPSMPAAMENTCKLIRSGKIGKTVFTQFLASEEPVGTWNIYNSEYASVNTNAFLCDMADAIKPLLPMGELYTKSTYSSFKSEQVIEAARNADHVLLAGVVAECCVIATLMEAIDLGHKVIYLYDCVSGQTPENEENIRKIAESFAPMHTLVMSSDEYLRINRSFPH